jgi:hypothetical protein
LPDWVFGHFHHDCLASVLFVTLLQYKTSVSLDNLAFFLNSNAVASFIPVKGHIEVQRLLLLPLPTSLPPCTTPRKRLLPPPSPLLCPTRTRLCGCFPLCVDAETQMTKVKASNKRGELHVSVRSGNDYGAGDDGDEDSVASSPPRSPERTRPPLNSRVGQDARGASAGHHDTGFDSEDSH